MFEDKEGRYDIVSAPVLTAEGRHVAIPVVGEKTTYHRFDKSLKKIQRCCGAVAGKPKSGIDSGCEQGLAKDSVQYLG